MRRPISSISFVLLVVCSIVKHHSTEAYPILIDVQGTENVCLTLDIPDNDDVHVVFSNLPEEVDPKIETWTMNEMAAITDHDSDKFLKMYSNPPHEISSLMRESGYKTVLDVIITGPDNQVKKQRLSAYKIMVMKNLAKSMAGNGPDDDWSPDKGMYEICIKGTGRGVASHAAFEHLVLSEFEEKLRSKHILKKEHLTPIEMNFDSCLVTAKAIMNEMSALERREARMKHTSDSMNRRIRMFSYVSISILLGVTWLQISYLKVYFKKKKVL
eukprot:CAMPEP_0198249322 /NCGR_PEP_ID=MMETSP1447-20131203/887_1 /TAXON_ID=420782 /ORGANISM="Chaetoceros dichaeta, Strain CCMP1751" /LENGTH=270 /DNA_ID=CAMNT_0043933931 /DNA_START=29 /DNA_END=841 /DNA_ORIENTATION=-